MFCSFGEGDGILPRTKKHATGMFFTSHCSAVLFESHRPNAYIKRERVRMFCSFGVGDGILPRTKKHATGMFFTSRCSAVLFESHRPNTHIKKRTSKDVLFFYGVGDGIRTHEYRNHNPVP